MTATSSRFLFFSVRLLFFLNPASCTLPFVAYVLAYTPTTSISEHVDLLCARQLSNNARPFLLTEKRINPVFGGEQQPHCLMFSCSPSAQALSCHVFINSFLSSVKLTPEDNLYLRCRFAQLCVSDIVVSILLPSPPHSYIHTSPEQWQRSSWFIFPCALCVYTCAGYTLCQYLYLYFFSFSAAPPLLLYMIILILVD